MRNSKLAVAMVTACMLSACQQSGAPGTGITNGGNINKQEIGTVGGGATANGVATSPAPVGGALLGGILGSSIGQSLDNADKAAYDATAQHALETGQPGQTMPWGNPQTGHSGTVTPENYYQNSSGQYCREYSQTVVVSGQQQSGYGKACRQPDGTWQIIQ